MPCSECSALRGVNPSYKNCVSDNITTYISDHLPQFLVTEDLKLPAKKSASETTKTSGMILLKQNLINFIGHW